jgi:hypothetical protein
MSDSLTEYTPGKWIWTAQDFENMGWHDVYIHGIAFDRSLLSLDIDYMFRWINPEPGETYYKFWLSPATLVFENVGEVRLSMESFGKPIIMDLTRSEEESIEGHQATWCWNIDCISGEISFRATGFTQFIRRAPIISGKQVFSEAERGGFSFSKDTPCGAGTVDE